jgi:hypothetical protein
MIRRFRFQHPIARLLNYISDYLKLRPIYHQGGLYLKRYYVCTLFNYWRIYLHHFVQSDPDGLHSHPWRYGCSILLCGSYIEQRRFGYRRIKFINIVNCDTFHRVIIPSIDIIDKKECWSLFIHSPRVCNWGFIRDKGMFKQYVEVGKTEPQAHSQWHKNKDTPTGKEWRLFQK